MVKAKNSTKHNFLNLKALFSGCLLMGFFGFLIWGYFQKSSFSFPAFAQDSSGPVLTELVCEEPIPIGEAEDQARDILDKAYKIYKASELKLTANKLAGLLANLTKGGEQICDWTKCVPDVVNKGGEIGLEVDAYLASKKWSLKGVPMICASYSCIGQPCPSLEEFLPTAELNELKMLGQALKSSAQNLRDLFSAETVTVPAGLVKEGEVAGETKITQPEMLRRLIDYNEYWLSPSPRGDTCALSEVERKKAAVDKIGDKFPMRCAEALEQNLYRPKPWSEACRNECEFFNEACKECLARCEGESVLAKINCKIYRENDHEKCAIDPKKNKKCCGKECSEGFLKECWQCLCKGLSNESCLAWLCGGSYHNWVCCHEEPMKEPIYYYAESIRHPDLPGAEECGEVCEIKNQEIPPSEKEESGYFLLTAYAPPCFCKGRCTASGKEVDFGDVAVYTGSSFLGGGIPHKTRFKITELFEAKRDGEKYNFGKKIEGGMKLEGNVIGDPDTKLEFCACDRGGDIKSGRIDIWLPDFDQAKNFGVKFGRVEIMGEPGEDPRCCKPVSNCCKQSFWGSIKRIFIEDDFEGCKKTAGCVCTEDNIEQCALKNWVECHNSISLCEKEFKIDLDDARIKTIKKDLCTKNRKQK